jgi:PEP-CTERM motif
MKKLLLSVLTASALALPALGAAPYYIAGDFNGWTSDGNLMTETVAGSGIWQVGLSMTTGRHEFKVTDGTWGWSATGPNSWLTTDPSGNVTLTYDANAYTDGWTPGSGRIGVSADPGTWTAVGDWQGWANANPLTAMTAQGGGIYELAYTIATPGSYQYKAVDTGTWDAIGADARNINATTYLFQTTAADQTVDFFVNPLNGSIKVDVIPVPEPSTFALFCLPGLAALVHFRRRS